VKQGKYTEAEPFYQHAIAIRIQQLGQEHVDTTTTSEDYAKLLVHMGRKKEVDKLIQYKVTTNIQF
jgi:hypothetical protein